MKHAMRYLLLSILLLTAALSTTRCVRRPLVDVGNTHYVRVYVDENLKNVTTGFYDPSLRRPDYSSPEIMRVALYDVDSRRIAAERFLRDRGSDDRGNYYQGYIVAPPGDYMLLAYNFDTESTVIRNDFTYEEAEAYTDEVAEYIRNSLSLRSGDESERIVYVPDHLFVDSHDALHIATGQDIDTLRNAYGDHFSASSLVKSYYLQVKVTGADMMSSAVGLLTGMSGSATLHDGNVREEDSVTIYFELDKGEPVADNEAYIYATFHTFGKLPDADNELSVTFDLKTKDGRYLTTTLDITDKFSEPDAVERQWILLDHVLNIPDMEPSDDGGFAPGVNDWEDIETDIEI